MRIAFINHCRYDYLTATIIEGINQLSRERRISLAALYRSNYARRRQVWPRERLLRQRRDFDLFVLGSDDKDDIDFFHQIADPARWPKLAALRRRIEDDPAVIYATALESGDIGSGAGACVGHIPLADVIEWFGG